MEHDDIVLEAISYRRHVGAGLESIRAYVGVREQEARTSEDDKAALVRLEGGGKVVRLGKLWFLTPEAYRQARGDTLSPKWADEDAWILLSLLYGRNRDELNLKDIIATADMINHSVPTFDEMYGALNRLEAARLIKERRGTLAVTERALDLYAKVEGFCKKGIYDQLDCLRKLIECPCCGVNLKTVRWQVSFNPSEYEDAVKAYSGRY